MTHVSGATTLLRAARLLDGRMSIDNGWILLSRDGIIALGCGAESPAADRTLDLGDRTLVPGFIDLHGHGGAASTYDEGPEQITRALELHRRHGTTRAVLSLVTNPIHVLTRSLEVIRDIMAIDDLVLGAHLEGPFLSVHNHGAHAPELLVEPSRVHVEALLDAGRGVLAQVTIAPELDGAIDAIRIVTDHGVKVAVGHTLASEFTTREAIDAGATILTHAFNAMPGIHHREPGPIIAAVADERMTLEIILDGVHVAPIVAQTLFRAAPGRVALITDAMAAAGSSDGIYQLGSLAVAVKKGVARVQGTDTIAGSTLTQDVALKNAVEEAGLDLQVAIAALTSVPAAALDQQHRLGYLSPGYVADVVALDDDLQVSSVWAAGSLVWGGAGADPLIRAPELPNFGSRAVESRIVDAPIAVKRSPVG